MRQKDITIPRDIVVKWISDFWDSSKAVISEIQARNQTNVNASSTGGDRYTIAVKPFSNSITLDFITAEGSSRPELVSTHIRPSPIMDMMDWITTITEYIEKAPSENEKK